MKEYDLVVIGGGSAGLVIAIAGAKLGKKTALVEKHRLGGDCLWTGCVPSKAMLKSAKVAHYIKEAEKYGLHAKDFQVDFQRVRRFVQRAQHTIEHEHDNPERFRNMGVDVIFGNGHFQSPTTFVVEDTEAGQTTTLKGKKFVISTGSRPAVPPIPGLTSIRCLDSENVWALEELPRQLLVMGAGPIGLELGQAFHRLGAQVTIVQRSGRIFTKEDAEVSEKMLGCLREEGIEILLNTHVAMVSNLQPDEKDIDKHHSKLGKYQVKLKVGDEEGEREVMADQILIAAGRSPNVEGLGLEEIGVRVSKSGIEVNDKLQTSVRNIYAAGDVIGHYLFTHVAAFQAQQIVRNMFFPGAGAINYSVVPWTTFTDPEVARCGLTEEEARRKYGDVDVFRVDQRDVDRAIAEDETKGFIKVVATKWTGKILGVHLIGPSAGEVIHEFVLAMNVGVPIRKLGSMIHVYPTFSSIVWRVAGKWLSEGSLIKAVRGVFSRRKK
jgi:pyruvate/2-oxoglutarate dehydrogenase complex dihydrolipoamide dehydrogenase (E3) component